MLKLVNLAHELIRKIPTEETRRIYPVSRGQLRHLSNHLAKTGTANQTAQTTKTPAPAWAQKQPIRGGPIIVDVAILTAISHLLASGRTLCHFGKLCPKRYTITVKMRLLALDLPNEKALTDNHLTLLMDITQPARGAAWPTPPAPWPA